MILFKRFSFHSYNHYNDSNPHSVWLYHVHETLKMIGEVVGAMVQFLPPYSPSR